MHMKFALLNYMLSVQVNYNRDLVNLMGQIREVISTLLCSKGVKDQTVTHKLDKFVQKLEQYSGPKGLM